MPLHPVVEAHRVSHDPSESTHDVLVVNVLLLFAQSDSRQNPWPMRVSGPVCQATQEDPTNPHQHTCTVTSKKYKLNSQQRFVINFKVLNGLGDGGKDGLLSEGVVKALQTKIGGKEREYKLCYSSKTHGFSTSTFHNKCDGKHDFLMVQQRADNKRIFGGWIGLKQVCAWFPSWFFVVAVCCTVLLRTARLCLPNAVF